jgi:hypothetical protein
MSYLSYIRNDKLNNTKLKKEISVSSKLSSKLNLTRNQNIDISLAMTKTLQKDLHNRIQSLSPIKKITEKNEFQLPENFNLLDPPPIKKQTEANSKFKFKSSLNKTRVDINTNAKFAVVDLNSNPYKNDFKQSVTEDYYSTTYSHNSTQANSMGMRNFSQAKLPNFKLNMNKVTASFMKSFNAPETVCEMTQTNPEILSKYALNFRETNGTLPEILKESKTCSPKTKKKTPSIFNIESQPKLFDNHTLDQEEIEFIYKKVFDKKFDYLINPKVTKKVTKVDLQNPEYKNKKKKKYTRTSYLEDKIKQIKQKIFFMKGIFDYSYPQILVGRIKICNSFLNKKEKEEAILKLKKNADDRYELHKSDPRLQKIRESMVVDNLKEMNTSTGKKEGEEEQDEKIEKNEKSEKLKMRMSGDMRQFVHKNGSLKKFRLSLENGKVMNSNIVFF